MPKPTLSDKMEEVLAALPDNGDPIPQTVIYDRLGYAAGVGATLAALEKRGIVEQSGGGWCKVMPVTKGDLMGIIGHLPDDALIFVGTPNSRVHLATNAQATDTDAFINADCELPKSAMGWRRRSKPSE